MTNPVATWTDPVNTTQDPASYKAALDGAALIAKRIVDAFAPHQSTVPNLTITLDAGAVLSGVTLAEIAQQVTGAITVPSGANKRIDRAVVDATTGVVSVITGTPTAGTPAAPAITAGKLPVAQLGTVASPLLSSTTAITNSMIVDERALFNTPSPPTFDAVTGLSSNGLVARTATNTAAARIITGTANQITVTNGDGVAGNPTLSLPSAITLPGSLAMGGLLDLGSTGQVQFPATQNASAGANVLDDYEEGTWTMSILFGGASVGQTFSQQSCNYIKVGKHVLLQFNVALSAKGSSTGTAQMAGFPFTVSPQGFNAILWSAMTTSFVNLGCLGDGAGVPTATFQGATAAATGLTARTATDFSNTTVLQGNISLFASA